MGTTVLLYLVANTPGSKHTVTNMKVLVVLALVGVVASSPLNMFRSLPGGQYITTYDNSWEHGFRDTSVEFVRPVSDLTNVGGSVSLKSAAIKGTKKTLPSFPYAYGLDSSEETFYYAGEQGAPVARTRSDRVQQLDRVLNSGLVDFSDEYRFRTNLQRAAKLGGKDYYINESGELFYLPKQGAGQRGAQAGSGVRVAKK